MKKAIYSAIGHWLEYFDTKNTTRLCFCSKWKHAKAIIKKTGIEQELVLSSQ